MCVGKNQIRELLQLITILLRPNVDLNLSKHKIEADLTITCKFLSFLDKTSL